MRAASRSGSRFRYPALSAAALTDRHIRCVLTGVMDLGLLAGLHTPGSERDLTPLDESIFRGMNGHMPEPSLSRKRGPVDTARPPC